MPDARNSDGSHQHDQRERRESGGGQIITGESLPPGAVYTIGTDPADRKLALFLIQTQVNAGSGRVISLGHLSSVMREALKAADAYLKAHIKDLGIDREPRQYDFTVQAVNLNQAKEGAETAIAFFISLVSALLERPVDPATVAPSTRPRGTGEPAGAGELGLAGRGRQAAGLGVVALAE